MYGDIKVIAFDADDTLWINEPFFRDAEADFCELLKEYLPQKQIEEKLFETEINNLSLYGYGIKAFTLSLIETAIEISNRKIDTETIEKIVGIGKSMLKKPVELLSDIVSVLKYLSTKNYKLIVATKGDLLDQERKLQRSGLEKYFHHIEVMSDKKEENYKKLIQHLDINPSEFLMIGNSLKSDVLPVINIGGYAIHIPFHTTWLHEELENEEIYKKDRFKELTSISQILSLF